jgi:TetR/AcrR family transcriptional regulator, regulator of autoinduction and epiphytic fitness
MQSQSSSSSTRRGYDASGRQAEARARRERVVAAARDLFLQRGYATTSIADIAAAAGVSVQMIYASFDGKAGLLGSVVDVTAAGDDDDVLLRERSEAVAALSIADPRARLEAIARQAAELNERVGPVLVIVESAAGADASVGELRDRIAAAMREDSLAVARTSLRDLRADLSIEEVADILRTLVTQRTWQSLVVEGGWSQARYTEWLEDALVRLLLD